MTVCLRCAMPATIIMRYDSTHLGYACFDCADMMMRLLAVENMKAGGTPAETADGYMRWRNLVDHPCSQAEADAVTSGGVDA